VELKGLRVLPRTPLGGYPTPGLAFEIVSLCDPCFPPRLQQWRKYMVGQTLLERACDAVAVML